MFPIFEASIHYQKHIEAYDFFLLAVQAELINTSQSRLYTVLPKDEKCLLCLFIQN